jgi:hypothetical protein
MTLERCPTCQSVNVKTLDYFQSVDMTGPTWRRCLRCSNVWLTSAMAKEQAASRDSQREAALS